MSVTTTVPARIADLEFELEVPDGFVRAPLPEERPDFSNPTTSVTLSIFSSPVALALVIVAARPAYETGSVLQWVRYLAGHFEVEIEESRTELLGGVHPAIVSRATQVQQGQKFNFILAAFEDGGRFVTAHGMCPAELWASFGDALTHAVLSITLSRPKGPTHDLDTQEAVGWKKEDADTPQRLEQYRREVEQRRAPAVERAEQLLREGEFDVAEREIMAVDSSISGGVAIARMYERYLREMVERGRAATERDLVEQVFRRALNWAQNCYPEPHTQEEADSARSGREGDLARLVGILGYEPA